MSERQLLLAIDAGPAHATPVGDVTDPALYSLIARGEVRYLPESGRWPARYVVTTRGSHALRTF